MTIFRYRSAHHGKSFIGLPMNVLPGVFIRAAGSTRMEELLAVLIVSPVGGNGSLLPDRKGSEQVPIYT